MRTDRQPDTSILTEYDEAIRLNPASAEVYFNRGLARASLNAVVVFVTDAIAQSKSKYRGAAPP